MNLAISTNHKNVLTNSKLIVGLTGGIGSGKTLVTDWFSKQNITIVDADVIAHDIVKKGSVTLGRITEHFGGWVLTETGELDRKKMREYVFKNAQALTDLEAITHPAIQKEAKKQLLDANSKYVIISAPLLLEGSKSGLAKLCNHIVVIDVPEDIQLKRASQRDGQTLDKIKSIMANQLSRNARNAYADDVVPNDGTIDELYDKLLTLHNKLLKIA